MPTAKIALLGNCQVQTMAALTSAMVGDVDVTIFDYSSTASREESNRRSFADSLVDVDYIFSQPTHLSYTSLHELRERYPGKTCIIGNFYFRGLFPDSCYIGSFDDRVQRPTPVNSVIILDAFLRGLKPDEAVENFSTETYQRLKLLDAWASSLDEMRKRDRDAAIDVPAADFMDEACRTYPAFLTMNHPTAVFLADYMSKVFDTVGLRHQKINSASMPDPLATHGTTPIDDVVAAHYKLPYRSTQKWRLSTINNRFIDKAEIVYRFYEAYTQTDQSLLLVHSPTDLVKQYEAEPELRYLVANDASTLPASAISRGWKPSMLDGGQFALSSSIDLLEEIKIFVHKIHSYEQVSDPKIERLVHELTVRCDIPNTLQQIERTLDGQYNAIATQADGQTHKIIRLHLLTIGLLVLLVVLLFAFRFGAAPVPLP